MIGFLIGLAIVLGLLIIILPNAIRIVREYQRLVVFRLGRCIGMKGPGFVLLIPLVDRAVWVDLRELYLEIPHQTAITEDNASISIDFIVFYKVIDAQQSVLAVANFAGAAQNIAATTLRSVVGDMALDDCLAKREEMNEILRVKLDEVTERWGVKVTNVEIREIIPPPQVQEAMTRQMSAERTRRAVVTEAEGTKQAQVRHPDGVLDVPVERVGARRQGLRRRRAGRHRGLELGSGLAPGPLIVGTGEVRTPAFREAPARAPRGPLAQIVRFALLVGALAVLWRAETRFEEWQLRATTEFSFKTGLWFSWVIPTILAGIVFGLAVWLPRGRAGYRWIRSLLLALPPLALLLQYWVVFGSKVDLPGILGRSTPFWEPGPQFALGVFAGVAIVSGFAEPGEP
ncbi:MAG: SPFH domain-containing protein [Candidatus Velamenicoccus archaeovorus]